MTVCGGQRGGEEGRRTIMYFGVSNFHSAMSIVIPRSRSAFNLSSTHAYLNEPLPSSAASCAGSVGHGESATRLLELLDRTLVDTTALVDKVAGGRRLARVDVADNDDAAPVSGDGKGRRLA